MFCRHPSRICHSKTADDYEAMAPLHRGCGQWRALCGLWGHPIQQRPSNSDSPDEGVSSPAKAIGSSRPFADLRIAGLVAGKQSFPVLAGDTSLEFVASPHAVPPTKRRTATYPKISIANKSTVSTMDFHNHSNDVLSAMSFHI